MNKTKQFEKFLENFIKDYNPIIKRYTDGDIMDMYIYTNKCGLMRIHPRIDKYKNKIHYDLYTAYNDIQRAINNDSSFKQFGNHYSGKHNFIMIEDFDYFKFLIERQVNGICGGIDKEMQDVLRNDSNFSFYNFKDEKVLAKE